MRSPIGISNFQELIADKDSKGTPYLFVDKSLFIRDSWISILYEMTWLLACLIPTHYLKEYHNHSKHKNINS